MIVHRRSFVVGGPHAGAPRVVPTTKKAVAMRQLFFGERRAMNESQPGDKSFTACGLVRRGRYLTSQTAFGGQLPYKGSLGRPAANNGEYTQPAHEAWFCDLRIMISANGISRDSHNGPPSLCCPFQQPSCASHWSAPDGLERLWTAPTATSVMSRRPAVCGAVSRRFLPSCAVLFLCGL